MPDLRSKTSTFGRRMAAARALWRATGMKTEDFGKPIVCGGQLLSPSLCPVTCTSKTWASWWRVRLRKPVVWPKR